MKYRLWKKAWRRTLAGIGVGFMVSATSGVGQASGVDSTGEDQKAVTAPSTLLMGVDQFSATPQLNLTVRSSGSFPVEFFLYSNYDQFINTAVIKAYTDVNKSAYKEIAVSKVDSHTPIVWDGVFTDGTKAEANKSYWLVLEVKDSKGNVDRTMPVEFRGNQEQDTILRKEKAQLIPGWGESQLDESDRQISLPNEMVVIRGQLQAPAVAVRINGNNVPVDSHGEYRETVFIPANAEMSYTIETLDENGTVLEKRSETFGSASGPTDSLNSGDIFYIALVDFTVGKRADTTPGPNGKYPSETYKDGRIAFYLKGTIQGKYLLTAQMDTGELETKDIFRKLGEREREELIQYIRPEDYYPVYGDGSTIEETVDSDGKFFVKLVWDKNEAKWGNIQTGEGMPELANYNRTLYGARVKLEDTEKTKFDQSRYFVSVHAANSDSTYERNEFLSTGGTLYYLKHDGIRDGSEKVVIEIRDSTTGRTRDTVSLSRGVDYDLDRFNGRIMLSKPLPLLAGSSMTGSSDPYLVVDYEYDENKFWDSNNSNYGIRATGWLGDYFRVGGTYAKEGRSEGDYKLNGGDAEFRFGRNSFIKGEYASSESMLGDVFRSGDGGISFLQDSGWDRTGNKPDGDAWRVDIEVDAQDFGVASNLKFKSYFGERKAGFSATADQTNKRIKERSNELLWTDPARNHSLVLREEYYFKDEDEKEEKQQIVYTHHWDSSLRTTLELRQRDYWDYVENERQKDLLGAIRVEKDISPKTTLYAGQRVTLEKEYDAHGRNRTLLGVIHQFSPAVTVQGEGFWGQDGNGGSVQVNGGSGPTTVYSRYWTDVEDDSDRVAGYGVGVAHDLSQRISLYVETQDKKYLDDNKSEKGQVYGFKYKFNERQSFDVNYSQSELTEDRSLGIKEKTDRSVWSFGYAYRSDNGIDGTLRFEQRHDGSSSKNEDQYVVKGKLKYDAHPDWQWYADTEISRTTDKYKGIEARYNKTTFGVAYRPTKNDKWNFLGKYTWIDNQDPDESTNGWDLMEKSQVVSFEGIFHPVREWQFSGKIAKKWGWYEDGNDNYSSNATLWGLRAQYLGWKNWEPFIEYRSLNVDYGSENTKDGFMVGMYRHLGGGLRVGAGYNFSSFNDDLTDLDQKREGWFFSVTLVK